MSCPDRNLDRFQNLVLCCTASTISKSIARFWVICSAEKTWASWKSFLLVGREIGNLSFSIDHIQTQLSYYNTSLFTGTTCQKFRELGATVSGFSAGRQSVAQRVRKAGARS